VVRPPDAGHAAGRASQHHSGERIRQVVEGIIAERIDEGELNECALSLRDLRVVADTFVTTLNAVYHPRVEYPEPSSREREQRGRGGRAGDGAGEPWVSDGPPGLSSVLRPPAAPATAPGDRREDDA
jgi:hypothetical protein